MNTEKEFAWTFFSGQPHTVPSYKWQCHLSLLKVFFYKNVYLLIVTERESKRTCMQAGEGPREGRENPKKAPMRGVEPDVGLNLMTMSS